MDGTSGQVLAATLPERMCYIGTVGMYCTIIINLEMGLLTYYLLLKTTLVGWRDPIAHLLKSAGSCTAQHLLQ
jgi:hypothetical protein